MKTNLSKSYAQLSNALNKEEFVDTTAKVSISYLVNQFEKISEILIYCRQLIFDSQSMIVAKTNEKHIVVSRDKFLNRVGDAFWKLVIIELTKLYGGNNLSDNLSIVVLMKYLRRYHRESEWNNLITPNELKQVESILKTIDVRGRVEKLKELRNQHFAHTDDQPDNNIYDIKFYFADCIFLIENAERIISLLSSKLLNKDYVFTQYMGEDVDSFLDEHIKNIETVGKYKLEKIENNPTKTQKELTQEQKKDFFERHLPHRLTLLRCLRERRLYFSNSGNNGDIYRCVKDSNLMAVRLFFDFFGLRAKFENNTYKIIRNHKKHDNDIKIDLFRNKLLEPSDVPENMRRLLAGVYTRADKELAHLTAIFNEEFNDEAILIEAATAIEELLKKFLYDPLGESFPPVSS